MGKNDNHSHDPFVEKLAGKMVIEPLFCKVLPGKAEQITDQLEVDVPVFIFGQKSRHEGLIGDEFCPCEGEVGVEGRIDFMQFTTECVIEGSDFILVEIVLFAGGIADEIEEQFEEGSLVVVGSCIFREGAVEDGQDGCQGVLQEDIGVIVCDQFVGDDDQLGVIFDVGGVKGKVVG